MAGEYTDSGPGANDCTYAMGLFRGVRLAERFEFGNVELNRSVASDTEVPGSPRQTAEDGLLGRRRRSPDRGLQSRNTFNCLKTISEQSGNGRYERDIRMTEGKRKASSRFRTPENAARCRIQAN